MHGEPILQEVKDKLNDGKTGCIIFDFAAYFPYSNNLIFNITLGTNELPDQKLNHRYYWNKNFKTISRKYGRKVSKIGYPHFFSLEDDIALLVVEVGVCKPNETDTNEIIKAIFPLKLSLTKDKPICGLSLNLNVEKMEFYFESYGKKEENSSIESIRWSSDPKTDNVVPLEIADADKECGSLLFCTPLEPFAVTPEELII